MSQPATVNNSKKTEYVSPHERRKRQLLAAGLTEDEAFILQCPWRVYCWPKSEAPYPPLEYSFGCDHTLEQVKEMTQERLDKLYVKSERSVQITRYLGALDMMQGGGS